MRTSLHLASEQGHQEVVSTLLQHATESGEESSILMELRDNQGDTPLHTATQNRQTEVVGFLLASGSDPNAENSVSMFLIFLSRQDHISNFM